MDDPIPYTISELESDLLLVLVHSSCKRRDRRDAIRATWLSGLDKGNDSPIHYWCVNLDYTGCLYLYCLPHGAYYRFVLGGLNIPNKLSQELVKEAAEYGDMMILSGNPDTALDLTQRTIESFHLAAQTDRSLYVLKCDEDSYVDIPRLASLLNHRDRNIPLYWGELLSWEIYTKGLYGERNYTVCDRYLPYALGGGYVLSRDLMLLLIENAPYLHRYVSEDVSVGAWLSPYNIERVHDNRFNTGADSRGCKEAYVVSHKLKPEDMYSYFKEFRTVGTFCSKNNAVWISPGHLYNWKVSPSKAIKYSKHLP